MDTLTAVLKSIAEIDLDGLFAEAVYYWVEETGNAHRLERFIQKYPDYIDKLDKGMQHQPLYRAVLMNPARLLEFAKGSVSDHRSFHKSSLESWTYSRDLADSWFNIETKWDMCNIVLKKNIPEKDRIICIDYDEKLGDMENEREVITKFQKKSIHDIDSIKIRLPFINKTGRMPEYANPGKDGPISAWKKVTLKKALHWAENYDAIVKEVEDQKLPYKQPRLF